MMLFKLCKCCQNQLDVELFTKRKRSKDGLDTYCKQCNAIKSRNFTKSGSRRSSINRRYAEKNRDKVLEDMRKWYHDNAEIVKKNVAKRTKEREKEDVNFKLTRLLRNRLKCAIKGNQKTGSAVRDLGCSIEELKKHLESKFQPGMTWENKDEWHIDHIKPLSSFDLSKVEQLKQACYYTNLQPLWAKDNLSKGDRFEDEIL